MIEQLYYFCKIAELGSISKTAESINISQPALSSSVKRLEKELDAELFERTPHGVELTKVGKRLLPYAQGICYNIDMMHKEINISKLDIRPLRIGGAMQHVSQIVNEYMQLTDNSNVFYRQYFDYYSLKSALMNHIIDVAICAPPIDGCSIETYSVFAEGFGVLVPENSELFGRDTVSIDEVQRQCLIGQPPNYPITVAIRKCMENLGISLTFQIEAENNAIYDLLRMNKSGNFIAIYPEYRGRQISTDFPSIRWIKIAPENLEREIAISYHKGQTKNRELQDFIKFCVEYYKTTYLRHD